jgi:hypothetical protein
VPVHAQHRARLHHYARRVTGSAMKPIAWFRHLSPNQQAEFKAAYGDHELSLALIAEEYGKNVSDICYAARQLDCPPRVVRRESASKAHTNGRQPVLSALNVVERELAELAAQEAVTKRRMEELRQRRLELSVRFERDEDDVLLYGVAVSPLRAPAIAWRQFLAVEGARKLREFLDSKF